MSELTVDVELDCRGMSCPIPILKTKKTIDGMQSGQVLKMLATDPGAINDVDAWTRRTGNPLLEQSQDGGEYIFFLRKK